MFDTLQIGLFDTDPGGVRLLDLAPHRSALTNGAWVDTQPGWVAGSDDLFTTLLDTVPWQRERRRMYDRVLDVPRLVRFYDEHETLPHPLLDAMREALGTHYRAELGEPFTTAGMCCYRDGADSVAWHGDRIGRSDTQDTMVAIVSLGDSRPLLLRPRGGGRSLRFPAGHGDLLVMGGSCQRSWEHCVPKTSSATGPRISIQFRPHNVR